MTATAAKNHQLAVGRSPDRLTLEERRALAGQYIAIEIYTPDTTPARRIEAIGATVQDCVRQLASRGLDPLHFEFLRLAPPY